MQNIKDRLIVALDVESTEDVRKLLDKLYPVVQMFKVGSQLFTACGRQAVDMIGQSGAKVFLDLKFHDIPNTVRSAVVSGTSSSVKIDPIPAGLDKVKSDGRIKESICYPVFMMTVHTVGGREMLKEAARGVIEKATQLKIKKPYLVGVTVLTSEVADKDTSKKVLERARSAKDAGLDGIVCAVSEAAMIRREFGEDFIIVTPGIRAKNAPKDDQARTATAKEAIEAGANYIVVGRSILEAEDPLKAVDDLLD
jgi:orotidine-5'-phosphate decarboxylase